MLYTEERGEQMYEYPHLEIRKWNSSQLGYVLPPRNVWGGNYKDIRTEKTRNRLIIHDTTDNRRNRHTMDPSLAGHLVLFLPANVPIFFKTQIKTGIMIIQTIYLRGQKKTCPCNKSYC